MCSYAHSITLKSYRDCSLKLTTIGLDFGLMKFMNIRGCSGLTCLSQKGLDSIPKLKKQRCLAKCIFTLESCSMWWLFSLVFSFCPWRLSLVEVYGKITMIAVLYVPVPLWFGFLFLFLLFYSQIYILTTCTWMTYIYLNVYWYEHYLIMYTWVT